MLRLSKFIKSCVKCRGKYGCKCGNVGGGAGGSSQNSSSTQTQTAQMTPEERELMRLRLERERQTSGGQTEAQLNSLGLINQLLTGQDLPGYLGKLPYGISESSIQDMTRKSISDLQPQFQSSGLLDSGVNAELSARTASNIRRGAEEYNLGNLFNLLNLAVGGQAQVQAPLLSQQGMLSQSLAGLRPVTQTGSSRGRSFNYGGNFEVGLNPNLAPFG